jgi:hypothetical protein
VDGVVESLVGGKELGGTCGWGRRITGQVFVGDRNLEARVVVAGCREPGVKRGSLPYKLPAKSDDAYRSSSKHVQDK